eukprot:5172317-Ditylum_brightwellii.AAC.1
MSVSSGEVRKASQMCAWKARFVMGSRRRRQLMMGGARAAASEQGVFGAELAAAAAFATNIGALRWYVMCQPKGNIHWEVVTV